jgi:hypothetical protein
VALEAAPQLVEDLQGALPVEAGGRLRWEHGHGAAELLHFVRGEIGHGTRLIEHTFDARPDLWGRRSVST